MALDILAGKELYKQWFTFQETKPLNPNYEMMDIESKNFILNSGSYLILIVLIIAWNLL